MARIHHHRKFTCFTCLFRLTNYRFQATVLLNANMAFLSIQSVDNGGQVVKDRSPAQIASYISIVTSVGSVILSLLLVRQNRSRNRQLMDEAVSISPSWFKPHLNFCIPIRHCSWADSHMKNMVSKPSPFYMPCHMRC